MVNKIGYETYKDLRTISPDDLETLIDDMITKGLGVLIARGQSLTPIEMELVCSKFARYFNGQQEYAMWPGQSKAIGKHTSMLGNYRAEKDKQFGLVDCVIGEQLGEFKPALNEIEEFHSDGSFLELPKSAIALYAPNYTEKIICPAEGAETRFASCKRASECLTDEERANLRKLTAVHSWETFMSLLERRDPERTKVTEEMISKKPDQIFPVLRKLTHRDGAYESIYVNPKNTKRLYSSDTSSEIVEFALGKELIRFNNKTGENSQDAVEKIAKFILDCTPDNTYAHKWKPGDFVLFDNRSLIHAASPFDANKYQRLLFRSEFKGEKVIPA